MGVENTEVGSLSEQEGGSQRGRRGVRVDEGGPAWQGGCWSVFISGGLPCQERGDRLCIAGEWLHKHVYLYLKAEGCRTLSSFGCRTETDSVGNTKCILQIHQIEKNSSVQIQIKAKFQLEFLPRDTKESGFLDLVNFRGVSFSVETVIYRSYWWNLSYIV